jgi:orotidine-5'-phosphate decarboxylase
MAHPNGIGATARERLVHALDVATLDAARRRVDELRDEVGVFKVGLELFTAAGPDAVRAVHDAGAECFLDLKLHDIPATMARATEAAAALGVRYLTVHAAAGEAALTQTATAARGSSTSLLAVTVLTSLDAAALNAIGLEGPPDAAVLRLAQLAAEARIPGLVASSHECARLREALPEAILAIPGIRPAGASAGDQRRVATPEDAVRAGADLLVVGRPIRDAEQPATAARAIRQAIGAALERADAERPAAREPR